MITAIMAPSKTVFSDTFRHARICSRMKPTELFIGFIMILPFFGILVWQWIQFGMMGQSCAPGMEMVFRTGKLHPIGNEIWGKALGIIWHHAEEVGLAWQVHHATIAVPVTMEASAIDHGGSEIRCILRCGCERGERENKEVRRIRRRKSKR
jgi:hypothetical protein